MGFKGLDQLRKHVPDLRTPLGSARIGLAVLLVFGLLTAAFFAVDDLWPDWTLVWQFGALIIGFSLVSTFFRQRKAFITRWGEMAYRNAFACYVLTGLPVIFAVVAHTGYMPGPPIPLNWWTPGVATLGWFFFVVGSAVLIRAVFTFGADNLAMLYVYFPEEGRLVDTALYGLLRHPTYAGIVRIGIGLGLLNGNWFALAFGLFMPLGLTIWLKLIEEKELLERFGAGYANYRRKTPAFWPKPRDIGKFFRFLLTGDCFGQKTPSQ
ncbi:MAG: isoprenylcysteine carboxylmethyltransferase family protein [Anaerolineales bacterium]|nr:isoprenylcysteine carboxylmethyltransferase family protein [Anaerolineales bacterium]MDO9348373.1 isoprenylcysteine carboxylmethyltransferase family protein [Anaerolineales bacterium]MDP2975269.1 isoprenylcysteine carboxylmethyltransferase family protein [Anaerolineales bacterium]